MRGIDSSSLVLVSQPSASPAPLAPAAFVEIKALRQAGVTPQPFDQ